MLCKKLSCLPPGGYLALIGGQTARAQSTQAAILDTVHDTSGAVVSGPA